MIVVVLGRQSARPWQLDTGKRMCNIGGNCAKNAASESKVRK